MKTIISVAILTLASGSATAANCAKNPNHSSCQGGDTTVIIDNSGLPTVVNGDGTAIGKAFALGFSYDTSAQRYVGYADVRLTYDTLTEGTVGYALRFYSDGISIGYGGTTSTTPAGIYRNAGCVGAPDYILSGATERKLTDLSLHPFFSNSFIPVQHYNGSGPTVSLVRLSAPNYVSLPAPYYYGSATSCTYYSSGSNRYAYEVLEGYAVGDQFSAPITFVPSEPN